MAIAFGYAAPETSDRARRDVDDLLALVGAKAGAEIAATPLPSYDRVTQLMHHGEIDLAWLSPIPFIALLRTGAIEPLASPQRGGTHYHGAIIVRADAEVGDLAMLAGKRAAWVDRYSAAGFVVPRIELAKAGLDVKKAFGSQEFLGSHAAVARAVAGGAADFGATFVRLAPNFAVVGGPWQDDPELERRLRIFATFGEIPPDVIAARKSIDAGVRDRVRAALLGLVKEPRGRELVAAVFGAEGLFVPNTANYESLRESAAGAAENELLDVSA